MFIFLGVSIATLICKNRIAEICQIQELVCWFVLVVAICVPFSDDTMTSQKGHVLLLVLVSAMFCGAVHEFLWQKCPIY